MLRTAVLPPRPVRERAVPGLRTLARALRLLKDQRARGTSSFSDPTQHRLSLSLSLCAVIWQRSLSLSLFHVLCPLAKSDCVGSWQDKRTHRRLVRAAWCGQAWQKRRFTSNGTTPPFWGLNAMARRTLTSVLTPKAGPRAIHPPRRTSHCHNLGPWSLHNPV